MVPSLSEGVTADGPSICDFESRVSHLSWKHSLSELFHASYKKIGRYRIHRAGKIASFSPSEITQNVSAGGGNPSAFLARGQLTACRRGKYTSTNTHTHVRFVLLCLVVTYSSNYLVNRRSVGLVHLVELIDRADAPVGKDEGTPLQRHLSSYGIPAHL